MIRQIVILLVALIACVSCERTEKRSARYNPVACPICSNVTEDGICSFCKGTKKCMYCDGLKERTEKSPNYSEDDIKPFSYKVTCTYCKGSGVCTYCNGGGKCWACNGTRKVAPDWECLNSRQRAGK